ncbi:MAG: helicase C-terminal domain-containing protein [bacterium]|nr:helicase C-terminal domain-containing protein [bacterium]
MSDTQRISLPVLLNNFPSTAVYRDPRRVQTDMLEFVAKHGSSLIEAPTGSGKTAVEYAIAHAAKNKFGTTFIITPNKTILDQIRTEFPDLWYALGRNEHPCLYYVENKKTLTPITVEGLRLDPENPRADEIPCSFLTDCPHRVYQDTGKTHEEGAYRCPYLEQKWEAKQRGVVVATMSFYLFTHLFTQEFDTEAVVIDEAHRIADVIRNALSYEITDYHLKRSAELLKDVAPAEAKVFRRFVAAMIKIAKTKRPGETTILDRKEIERLLDIISDVDSKGLAAAIKRAVEAGQINPRKDRVELRKLEVLVRDIRRYIKSFEYSMPIGEPGERGFRNALNYTCAYHKVEKGERDKVEHKLVIKCYYVVPIVRKILPSFRVSLSATIGDPEVFGYESGIKDPFLSLGSNFPAENARIYMPQDTPNLALNNRSRRDLPQSLRKMARAAKRFSNKGIRSLVVTISNDERERFLIMAEEEKLDAMSYGNGVTAKEAALRFRDGEGKVLVGTAANYSEGVDLPKQMAPVIFFLRPGYPNPRDPMTQFEEQRFGGARWALWNWRVMQQALQVRGRNVRSRSDIGVTFFISQQFRRVLFAALPEWLQKSYRGEITFDEAVKDAERLLG